MENDIKHKACKKGIRQVEHCRAASIKDYQVSVRSVNLSKPKERAQSAKNWIRNHDDNDSRCHYFENRSTLFHYTLILALAALFLVFHRIKAL